LCLFYVCLVKERLLVERFRRSSSSAAAPLQRLTIDVRRSARTCVRPDSTPMRFQLAACDPCDPRLAPALLAWAGLAIECGCHCGDALPVLASHSQRRHVWCAASPCASAFVARDRPIQPKQSADAGTAGGPVMTGPPSEPSGSAAGTSPEVFVPFSADQPRRALCRMAASHPNDPASAFRVRRAPR
jgi:hypothetical protein